MTSYHQLTHDERYAIAGLSMAGHSRAEIARCLGRHRSTIVREFRRNRTTHDGKYRAEKAHSYAVARRRRCRRRAHFSATDLAMVARLLRRKWSPEQIAGTLRKRGTLRISHETIYRRIRWDKRIGGELWRHTRIMSKFGRKRYRSLDSRGVLPGKRPIAERPAEVELRQTFGHWEGDTVIGQDKHHCILTLVERKTGFAILQKLSDRNSAEVNRAASRALRRHASRFKTLTLDNGTEFHDYAALERRFPVKIYFATPYHSWERGSNENFNGLLRQYLPRGTCFRNITQAQCDHIADDLNRRPRKRHDFDSPHQRYPRQ